MGIFSKLKATIAQEISFYNTTLKDVVLKKIDNRYVNFSTALTIYGEDKRERCVFVGEDNTLPLWCLELSKSGSETVFMDNRIFQKIAIKNGNRPNCKFTIIYSKRPVRVDGEEDFYVKQSTYLFSYDRRLIKEIADEFDIELMQTNKIIQAFYDLGLINKYYIDKETLALKSRFHFTSLPKDALNNLYFKQVFSEGVYNALVRDEDPSQRNYRLFQGINIDGEYLSGEPDLYRLYQEQWYGYIAMNVNLSHDDTQEYIEGANTSVQFGEKSKEVMDVYREAADNSKKLATMVGICNIVACLDTEEPINRLASLLNVIFIPKSLKAKNILYGTPVTYKDGAYDFITPITTINGWIKSIHKKHNSKARTHKHMYGRDVSYNFVNYSWSETGDSLHWAIVAPTRSGKTFAILKTIQSALGIEIRPKTEEELEVNRKLAQTRGELIINEKIIKASKLGKTKVVHFDTGQSAFPFVTELKRSFPDQVHISQDNINHMRFGLINMKYDIEKQIVDENDLLFSVSIINLILSLGDFKDSVIGGSEEAEFRGAVQRVFKTNRYRGLTIAELEKKGGYDEVIDKLYAYAEQKGIEITRHTRTTDLQLEGTSLEYMQMPVLSDVIKEVDRKSQNDSVLQHTRDTCTSLLEKLRIVEKMDMFAYYDKSNIHITDYYYLELQQLKELGTKYFLPAYMITIRRLYRRDFQRAAKLKAMKKPLPDIIYILEEVHNFIKIPILEKYFEVITREASRYHIYFGFITQLPGDIPPAVLKNVGSRMVLSSNRVTKNDLAYYWSSDENDQEQAKYFADFYHTRKRKYLVFIHSGEGIVTIDQKVSASEAGLFNSNGQADLAEEIEDEVA